ncbi:hypothetical protein [Bifidobacterium sp. SO4]|uniref:hypothetical protein n=1 Tax=Bifidobacterium sp. SO4 TaxID=2809030 RepID=UPI001F0A4D58|nr:hypothetical protein [Bifidobacterium sp. SO4]
MADETTIEDQTEPNAPDTPATPPADDSAPKPPWERDGEDFNPEKAWNLIQNLRADNAKLKESNESLSLKQREAEDAKLTE